MAVNYNDSRFKDVEKQKTQALNEVNTMYNNMINQSDKFYQDQINASNEYAETQKELQQQQTDFAIEQVNQNKEWAKQDYLKEQKGSYADYQKASNTYGANAEAMASRGLTGTGYAESSMVSMYNQYQNRVATARDGFNRAIVEYDNQIKEAQLQNSSKLAEIAYKALQTKLELSLQGFQYKNTLLQQQMDEKNKTEDRYYARWQDVLQQINTENALAEQQRQFNASMALQREQFNWEKAQANASRATVEKEGSGSGAYSKAGLVYGLYDTDSNKSSVNKSASGSSPVGATAKGGSVKSGGNTWYTLSGDNFGKLGLSGAPSQKTIDSLVSKGKLKTKVIDGKMYYRKP